MRILALVRRKMEFPLLENWFGLEYQEPDLRYFKDQMSRICSSRSLNIQS